MSAYYVQIYKIVVDRDLTIHPIAWVDASIHTQAVDAKTQLERFKQQGYLPEVLRIDIRKD